MGWQQEGGRNRKKESGKRFSIRVRKCVLVTAKKGHVCRQLVDLVRINTNDCTSSVPVPVSETSSRYRIARLSRAGGHVYQIRTCDQKRGKDNPLPSEVEDCFERSWDRFFRPWEKVELSNGSTLICFQVLEKKWSNQIILAPDVFGNEMHFKVTIDLWSTLWPVATTQAVSWFHQPC